MPQVVSKPPTLPATMLRAGEDLEGFRRGLGISVITFKVVPTATSDLLVLENTFHAKGGPARHLHYDQDEWFYAAEGEFVIEIGGDRPAERRLAGTVDVDGVAGTTTQLCDSWNAGQGFPADFTIQVCIC